MSASPIDTLQDDITSLLQQYQHEYPESCTVLEITCLLEGLVDLIYKEKLEGMNYGQ